MAAPQSELICPTCGTDPCVCDALDALEDGVNELVAPTSAPALPENQRKKVRSEKPKEFVIDAEMWNTQDIRLGGLELALSEWMGRVDSLSSMVVELQSQQRQNVSYPSASAPAHAKWAWLEMRATGEDFFRLLAVPASDEELVSFLLGTTLRGLEKLPPLMARRTILTTGERFGEDYKSLKEKIRMQSASSTSVPLILSRQEKEILTEMIAAYFITAPDNLNCFTLRTYLALGRSTRNRVMSIPADAFKSLKLKSDVSNEIWEGRETSTLFKTFSAFQSQPGLFTGEEIICIPQYEQSLQTIRPPEYASGRRIGSVVSGLSMAPPGTIRPEDSVSMVGSMTSRLPFGSTAGTRPLALDFGPVDVTNRCLRCLGTKHMARKCDQPAHEKFKSSKPYFLLREASYGRVPLPEDKKEKGAT